eukprot:4494931-Lingulodinium_polyedra.AAC.1
MQTWEQLIRRASGVAFRSNEDARAVMVCIILPNLHVEDVAESARYGYRGRVESWQCARVG